MVGAMRQAHRARSSPSGGIVPLSLSSKEPDFSKPNRWPKQAPGPSQLGAPEQTTCLVRQMS
ncbi:hypothetical protein J1614_010113 [Plenodomus biglobosus]|nr:hypothetical protein J1614_010113 [Plenodomus biglobosus]